MKDIAKMKRDRQKLIDEMRSITAEAEKRDDKRLTQSEADRWQVLNIEVGAQGDAIKRAERENEIEGESAPAPQPEGDTQDPTSQRSKFANLGEFLLAVRSANVAGGSIDERLVRSATGQNETNPADGGFLVEKDQMTEILKRTYDQSLIAQRCRRVQVGPTANGLKWVAIDESSRATGSRFGGVRGYWQAEADTANASKIKFRKASMDLEKLMAFAYVTEELLQDAPGLTSIVEQAVAEEFAWLLDDAIVSGTGAGTPLGYLNSKALVSIDKEAGQPAKTIVYENIMKMYSRMWGKSRANANWFINQDCESQLWGMALAVGTGGIPVYLPASTVAPTPTLFGRPVVAIEQAKTLGAVGDISLTDMSQYLLIDKGGINSAMSIHVKFLNDENCFRFTYRVNGQPTWASVLTPANGTNTLSPFVALKAR